MTSQVVRPGLPYTGIIPNGIQERSVIEINGTVLKGYGWFDINLLAGIDTTYSDRPLHISVRMDKNVAVRNTLQHDSWLTEERQGKFPFRQGQSFTMKIEVKSHCYSISVNNQHCWDFVHRLPFCIVTVLHIKGSVTIERIQFVGKCVTPSTTCEPAYPATPFPPVFNPCIPYAYPIFGGLKPGMMIYICGKPTMNPNRFTINLQTGTDPNNPPDIAFHFDVRFFNQTIIRNTRTNNSWQHEEKQSPSFPFSSDCRFDMMIRVTKDQYMVAVNGQHFIEFKHRLWPLSRFDTLGIESDISVQSIRFA